MTLQFPSIIEFDSIFLIQFGLRFTKNLDATIHLWGGFGLIAKTICCPLCAKPCIQQNYFRGVDLKKEGKAVFLKTLVWNNGKL